MINKNIYDNFLSKGELHMQEKEYFSEIESFIKKNEIRKKEHILESNYETLRNYWEIGRLIVEAQNGNSKAKYGDELIKKWSKEFTNKYGKGYDATNLKRFRQYYLIFQKSGPVGHQLSWTHFRYLIPIKNENKRNYYINLCIEKKLSKNELIKEIKSNSYERLLNKPKQIEIIQPRNNYSLLGQTKNPIIIEIEKGEKIKTEKELEITIISKLKLFFNQLGEGFAFIDNQYKINYENKNYFIDILLFNYKLNCFIVVELKLRKLLKEDKAQVEFYMDLIDKNIKEPIHNKTIGIIITKQNDKLIANFVKSDKLIPLTYKLKNK